MVLEYAKRSGSVAKALKAFKFPKQPTTNGRKSSRRMDQMASLRSIQLLTITRIKLKKRPLKKCFFFVKTINWDLGESSGTWSATTISAFPKSSVSRILKRYGVERLQKKAARRSLHSKRYNKSVPGHHVQLDVKVLLLKDLSGKAIKRFQYTAIDDATRIRALQIYPQQNQANATRVRELCN